MHEFNTEMSDIDRETGFELRDIVNPRRHFFGQPSTVKAIVLDLGPSFRMIKYNRPEGGINYKLQQFGTYPFAPANTKPEWCPADSGIFDDPVRAAEYAKRYLEAEFGPMFVHHEAYGEIR